MEDVKPKRLADIPADLDIEAGKLAGLCLEMGIELNDEQSRKLVDFLALVLKKNEVINLTAIREWDKGLVLHLVDSIVMLPEFDGLDEKLKERPFLDMGCGAGFPGIPLALVRPDRKGVLCDSVKKKIAAVEEFTQVLGISDQLSGCTDRLEDLGHKRRRSFGCITARALSSLPVLVEYATPLLAKNGCLIAEKGRPSDEELIAGKKAAKICGLEVIGVRNLELPQGMGERTIIMYGKVDEPSISLPRETGEAVKKPLA